MPHTKILFILLMLLAAPLSRADEFYTGLFSNTAIGGHDPVAFFTDGKLYLNYNASDQADWEKGIPGFIEAANTNWPGVLD